MVKSDPIRTYLSLMDAQADSFFSALPSLSHAALWGRPAGGAWSHGENLSHIAVVHRFFRRFNRALWPLASLVARARRPGPSEATIDDVYARPDFPHAVGRFWPPAYSIRRPVPLDRLRGAISAEHRMVRAFYEARDPGLLGRARLYFPAIGWVSYIQSLRIAVFHDAHHFAEIRRVLASTSGSAGPDERGGDRA